MKNLKKMMAFGILMGGLTASNSFAGIIMSDFAKPTTCVETDATGIIMSDFTGIIVSDATGIIMSDFTGIIMSDLVESNDCKKTGGIIVSD